MSISTTSFFARLLHRSGSVICVALALSLAGCKTTKQPPVSPMITPLVDFTGQVSSDAPLTTASVNKKNKQGKTSESQEIEQNEDADTFSLAFAKGKYSISKTQNDELGAFVKEGSKKRKSFQVVAYAEPQPAGTSSETYSKTLLEAKRRSQAVALFLRVHGVTADKTTVRTDETPGISPREVQVVLN